MKENRVCLVVIDGWGINDLVTEKPFDAIANSETPLMNAFCPYITGSNHITIKEGTSKELEDGSNVSSVRLQAHGLAVGLPADLMGNSEVGHLNIGAGRIVYQDIVRIEKAITERNLEDQGALPGFFASVRGKASCETPARVHMIGLVSDGGVHSHMNHLFALLDLFEGEENVQIYVHFIADGRDTSPTSGVTFLNTLIEKLSHKYKKSKLATVIGRYYAMDRDQRWERTLLAYDALVLGKANDSVSLNEITPFIESKYSRNETDEFLKPIQVDFTQSSCIEDGDSLLFFNYRSDRMRQLVSCFLPSQKKVYPSAPGCTILRNNLTILTMTQYHSDFSNTCNNVGLLFPPQTMTNVLAEWVSKQTLRQCHIAGKKSTIF